MSAYDVRKLEEFDAIAIVDADITWRPIRRTLGIRAFGINAYTANEGQHVVEEHTEETLGHEEVYVVVAGRARFVLGEDEFEVDAGTLVYVRDPAMRRAAFALEPGTTVLAVGGKPGEAYEPSVWEWFFAASPLAAASDYEAALATVRDGMSEKPDHPALHYYAGMYEARLGRRDDALASLRRAIAGGERFAKYARETDHYEPLRDDTEFRALVGTDS